MTTFRSALQVIWPDDFQAVYDLTSEYHHIRMSEEDSDCLGFEVEEGVRKHYKYVRMPFGLSTAGQVLDRILKPICAQIAAQGIRHSIYIDDGRISAASKLETQKALRFVQRVLKSAGFKLAVDKSDTYESVGQVKEYLGFEINTVSMQVSVPERKS